MCVTRSLKGIVEKADGGVAKDDKLTNYTPSFKRSVLVEALEVAGDVVAGSARRGRGPGEQREADAFAGEGLGGGQADPAAGAGDDRGLAVEGDHQVPQMFSAFIR